MNTALTTGCANALTWPDAFAIVGVVAGIVCIAYLILNA